jgi:hypothetical protein
MPAKKSKSSSLEILAPASNHTQVAAIQPAFGVITGSGKLRNAMHTKNSATANEYQCAIERNQNGKYNVRVRAVFAPEAKDSGNGRQSNGHRSSWMLPVYFLASSFNAAMKKLEEALQLLQKHEAKLRFWGVERTDDPNLAGDLLKELGLGLDRRREFPRKVAELGVPRERPVPAASLAPVRRILADSVAQERPVDRQASVAGD